jgi:surface antigen
VDPANPFADSPGECVYWAVEARPDIWNDRSPNDPGRENWDAWTWAEHGRAEGLSVNGVPQPGDVAVWSQAQVGNSYGHVAYVEAVNADRSITVSEMNHYYGTQGGDTEILAPVHAPDGWQGLQFIHVSSAASGASGSGGGTQLSQRSPTSGAPSHMHLSGMKRKGRLKRFITFRLRITPGLGTPRAVAVDGRRRVRLHFKRSSARLFVFQATLSPGRWMVTVRCNPASGYAAPRPIRVRVSIPSTAAH